MKKTSQKGSHFCLRLHNSLIVISPFAISELHPLRVKGFLENVKVVWEMIDGHSSRAINFITIQTVVTAYFSSKQLLLFIFAGQLFPRLWVLFHLIEKIIEATTSSKSHTKDRWQRVSKWVVAFWAKVGLLRPANVRRWPNAGLLLGQRRRRWANSKPTLGHRFIFTRVGNRCGLDFVCSFTPWSLIIFMIGCLRRHHSEAQSEAEWPWDQRVSRKR